MKKKQYEELEMKGVPVPPCILAKPKTVNQDRLYKAIQSCPMTVGIGFAGTGKTFITGMTAAAMLSRKEVDKIIITRPNVPTGRTLGHFPGTVEEKMAPWLAPITSVLIDGLGKGAYEAALGRQIFIQPMETIRGMSFENAFIIVDEAQNLNMEEIKALTTRIGEDSRMVLIGDPNQSDVKKGNDLMKFVQLCNEHDIGVALIEFDMKDIVRSETCAKLIRMFYEENL